jgi:hypothetical protein
MVVSEANSALIPSIQLFPISTETGLQLPGKTSGTYYRFVIASDRGFCRVGHSK